MSSIGRELPISGTQGYSGSSTQRRDGLEAAKLQTNLAKLLDCGSPLPLSKRLRLSDQHKLSAQQAIQSKSGRGLPQSKSFAKFRCAPLEVHRLSALNLASRYPWCC